MVRQLDCPDLFVTFSAADYHWHSLLKHMDSHLGHTREEDQLYSWDKYMNGTRNQRVRYSRKFLRDNPAIAAYHFHRRVELFRRIVLERKFCLTDYWSRYEWQARGSTHSHGLYWVSGAPDNNQLNKLSPELPQEFLDL
jgi:ATP-dependent DNA helicase PIF1